VSSIWSCLFFILFSGIWSRPLIVFYTILVYLSIWHLIFNRNSDYTSTSVHLFQYSIVISTFLCYIFFFYVCIGIESIIRTESANKFLQQMIMHGYQSAATDGEKKTPMSYCVSIKCLYVAWLRYIGILLFSRQFSTQAVGLGHNT